MPMLGTAECSSVLKIRISFNRTPLLGFAQWHAGRNVCCHQTEPFAPSPLDRETWAPNEPLNSGSSTLPVWLVSGWLAGRPRSLYVAKQRPRCPPSHLLHVLLLSVREDKITLPRPTSHSHSTHPHQTIKLF